ncbi:MAG: 2-oxo acid dehydrogenase subunit E2 [Tepidisphaeraceae bacterium]|jgi:pyruvate dehydrogenase E2 component (dihydrolipoamide acetyltransferase)
MPTLTLPQAGKSASNATVLRWRKKAGDAVNKGEVLLEVETDDGLVEIESAVDGTLKDVLAAAGKTIPIGAPLAIIDNATGVPTGGIQTTKPASEGTNPKANPMSNTNIAGKVIPILMPKAGQSMEEGVIVKWHVKPGAAIKKGDIIFEIETDKATMEVEAPDAGRLSRIVVADGGNSAVLLPVAYLADNDADMDAFIAAQGGGAASVTASAAPAAVAEKPATTVSTVAATTESGRVKASPAARKIASERGVDLATVAQGSGPGGRILSTDVLASAASGAGDVSEYRHHGLEARAAKVPQGELPAGVVRKRMSGMRKAIARNLTLSKTTIPHWYISSRINAGQLMSFYKSQKAKFGCSVNDVIVMACARAIMEFPAMHSRVDGETILEFPGANIGMAVGMDDGLVVPVVMNAEKFTLEQLSAETKRLANQARAGKIENMGMGIFTISNLGMFGVDEFVAIVNPPEAAILAVSSVREDVIVKDGAIKAGQTMNITLSSDHRLIDGTLGAQFMAKLKTLLENPIQLIA